MKLLLTLLLFSTNTLACDFSKGITEITSGEHTGSFSYSPECNRKVKDLVDTVALQTRAIGSLKKVIKLKDLQITNLHTQNQKLNEMAYRNIERMDQLRKYESKSKLMYFSFGIATSILTTYAIKSVITQGK